MSVVKRCRDYFGPQIQVRGQDYFRRGRVELVHLDRSSVEARVKGSYRSEYEVRLDWSDARRGRISGSCTCPYFEDGFLCKHLWATLLAVEATGEGPTLPEDRAAIVVPFSLDPHSWAYRDDEDLDEDDENDWPDAGDNEGYLDYDYDYDEDEDHDEDYDEYGFPRPGSMRSEGPLSFLAGEAFGGTRRRGKRSRRAQTPSWSDLSEQLQAAFRRAAEGNQAACPSAVGRHREAWYVLDVGAVFERGYPVIELRRRESRKDGSLGQIKKVGVVPSEIATFTVPKDRELLDALLSCPEDSNDRSYGYGYYQPKTSRVIVPPAFYEALLPKLCATGRFIWVLDTEQGVDPPQPLAWDDGPPWRLRLCVRQEEEGPEKDGGSWALSGELVRPDDRVSLDEPVVLTNDGLVLFPGRLARHEVGDLFPWVVLLRQASKLPVAAKDRFKLLRCLWSLPVRPEIELPEELRVAEVAGEPHGRLQVHEPERHRYSTRKYLYARILFDYDGRTVDPGDAAAGLVDEEGERVLVRDRDRERGLLDDLAGLKLEPVPNYERSKGDVSFPESRLTEVVTALVHRGWTVEAEGLKIRRPGEFRAVVSSGVDWFDLDAEFDYEGVSAKLPDLLAALRHGEQFVRLSDGSQGILPEKWLARFRGLAEMGEANEGVLRFAPSQAMLLDALLAAQDHTQVDRKFDAVRKRLRGFTGVEPRGEPRGFVGQLRGYQKEGLGWLRFLQDFGLGGCLADDMGLGKTIQVLALLQWRRLGRRPKGETPKPSLVVVPRSLIFNWIDEAARFAPNLRVLNYTGLGRAALREEFTDHDVVLTTYGTMRRDVMHLKDVPFDYAILDEATAIKNDSSQAAKASRLIRAEHRLALTGTPVENHLGELWSLFEFLNPGMLGRSTAFKILAKRAAEGDRETRELLARALSPYLLRRTKEQVLTELPEKTEQTLFCEMKPKQRKQYDQLRDYYRVQLDKKIETVGLKRAKIQVLEALLRLRQAACHPGLLDKEKTGEPSAKLDSLLEQLSEVVDEGHKALIFSQFTSLLAIVRRRLEERGLCYEYLDGRTRKRGEKVRRFQQDAKCPLFLISLKAGGHGLNLTAADYVYVLDPWWNPAVESQAVDRAHRIGQTRRVFAYRMICRNTVEERILELQQSKRDLADAIVSADRNLIRELTAEDLQLLLT